MITDEVVRCWILLADSYITNSSFLAGCNELFLYSENDKAQQALLLLFFLVLFNHFV